MVNIYKTIFSINKGEDMSKILKNVKKFLMEELKVEYMSHFTSSPYINIESLYMLSVSRNSNTHNYCCVWRAAKYFEIIQISLLHFVYLDNNILLYFLYLMFFPNFVKIRVF